MSFRSIIGNIVSVQTLGSLLRSGLTVAAGVVSAKSAAGGEMLTSVGSAVIGAALAAYGAYIQSPNKLVARVAELPEVRHVTLADGKTVAGV